MGDLNRGRPVMSAKPHSVVIPIDSTALNTDGTPERNAKRSRLGPQLNPEIPLFDQLSRAGG
jgi:hypothetical protein